MKGTTLQFFSNGSESAGIVEICNIIQTRVTYNVWPFPFPMSQTLLMKLLKSYIETIIPELRVRSFNGILAPGQIVAINVVMQPGHLRPVSTEVDCMKWPSRGRTGSRSRAALWKSTSSNNNQVQEHRLDCWIPASVNGTYFHSFDEDRQVFQFSSRVRGEFSFLFYYLVTFE